MNAAEHQTRKDQAETGEREHHAEPQNEAATGIDEEPSEEAEPSGAGAESSGESPEGKGNEAEPN